MNNEGETNPYLPRMLQALEEEAQRLINNIDFIDDKLTLIIGKDDPEPGREEPIKEEKTGFIMESYENILASYRESNSKLGVCISRLNQII